MRRGEEAERWCVEMVMAISNDPTKTDALAAIVFQRLSDARRLTNKKKEMLQQAVRAFKLMQRKDKRYLPESMAVSQTNCDETLLDGTMAMERIAGRSNEEGTNDGGRSSRSLYGKMQGPIVGMTQVAILLGGTLETDSDIFCITFNEAFPTIHFSKCIDSEWKRTQPGL